jgi:type I restriction-modification system DNA methylase subunit
MPDHNYFATLIWQIADLLRGPYRPPQYERVMLPMTVLRRFDSVLAPTKPKVLAEYERAKDKFKGDALDARLNKAAGKGWRVLWKAHDTRNRTEYEGAIDVDERLLSDQIKACRTVADKVKQLPPIPREPK